ncbi:MAG TPA: histidine kinase, partial [Ktedonobacterales bacterium]|nr:histidine kinase [Ktedonobacterales bacterium]
RHPGWLHSLDGLWISLLAIVFFLWYGSYWWYAPAHMQGAYFHPRMVTIRLIYWFGLLGLTLALNQIDSTFGNLMWVVFGTSLGMLRLPWNFALGLIPIGFILAWWNIFPHANTLAGWLDFLGSLLSFVAYAAITVMFSFLVQQRFQREAIFHQLETAHEQLRQAHTQLEDSAEHERELAVLRERERLSREMHDTLGHALVLTTVKLEAVRRLMDVDPPRADHEIGVTQDIVRQAMGELRATLATLHDPATAGCDPFTVSLERHAREIGERTGMVITCDIASEAAQWPKETQTALLRIGAEAMNNIEHHAQAHHMTLTIADDGVQGLLRVADDGVGLPALPVTRQGEVTSPAGHLG